MFLNDLQNNIVRKYRLQQQHMLVYLLEPRNNAYLEDRLKPWMVP